MFRTRSTQAEELTPSKIRKTTIYETRRKIDQPKVEEQYEVTISSNYDESGLKILSPKSSIHVDDQEYFELDEELYIACAILNESLYDSTANKKKLVNTQLFGNQRHVSFVFDRIMH